MLAMRSRAWATARRICVQIFQFWRRYALHSYRPLIRDVRQLWLQAQPGSGEAAFDQPGLVLDLFRPCRMTWIRWAKLATARLARTPRLSTDQIPSTGLRSGA